MAKLDDLFKIMVAQDASDLHITSGAPPYLRVHGEMMKVDHASLTNKEIQALVFEILSEKQKRDFIENWELDCSYQLDGIGRFRCNIFMQRKGLGAVFRVIPTEIKTVHELGLPEIILKLADVPRGLILVTGPTGSGKSTTLAAILHTINMERKEHILTVEDPIEFVHENQSSLVNQREVSSHTKSFANALKAALREDPDIILVGEMRDLETISLALTAAETGHLVFGTLHTNSAAKTVDRIIDVFPEGQQAQVRIMLAESLRGVIAQQLFPRIDKPGRVAAIEILKNTNAISNLIRENKTYQIPSSMQTGGSQGMQTFEKHITELISQGIIDKSTGMQFLGHEAPEEATKAPASTPAAAPARPAGKQKMQNPYANKPNNAARSPQQSAKPTQNPAPAKPAAAAPAKKPEANDSGIKIYDEKNDVAEKASGLLKSIGFGKKSG